MAFPPKIFKLEPERYGSHGREILPWYCDFPGSDHGRGDGNARATDGLGKVGADILRGRLKRGEWAWAGHGSCGVEVWCGGINTVE